MAKESAVKEKKPQSLVMLLAALFYFDSIPPVKRKEAMAFEKLTEAEQSPYTTQANKFLVYLDKLNLSAQPKVDAKKAEEAEQRNLDILTGQIKDFVAGLKTTKPNLFPCDELALRILRGPDPEKPAEEKKE